MALIKKDLGTILGAFAKPLADLNVFIDEQTKRDTIAKNNVDKLNSLIDQQERIQGDAQNQIADAEAANWGLAL